MQNETRLCRQVTVLTVAIGISFLATFLHSDQFLALAQTKQGAAAARRLAASPPPRGIHRIVIHPNDSQKVYSSTEQGLQVSENGGVSWRSVRIGGQDQETFGLAVDRSNPDTLYTGRRDGLWKSIDGGKSWALLPHPGSAPLSVAIAKSERDTIYIATSRQGVYRSTTGGSQWTEINTGLPEARAGGRPEEIHTLAVAPADSNVVYAAIVGHGIYRTLDGGASWQQFNQGLLPIIAQSVLPPKLGFDPVNPSKLYLAFNQRIHSRLVTTRVYVLSGNAVWLPVELELPSNFPILDLAVDGARNMVQLWGSDAVWEVPVSGR